MVKIVMNLFCVLVMVGTLSSCASDKSKTSDNTGDIFELVSTERVNHVTSNAAGGTSFYWNDTGNENGILIILKYKGDTSITIFSTDFSLGFEHEYEIPRRACIGISFGYDSTNDKPNETLTWMLGGSISRTWASKEKPYFGIIFEGPKSVDEYSLFYAKPLIKGIKVK
jgi:hypothetical protein